MRWYEASLEPRIDAYLENHTDLTWVTTTMLTDRKPNPLVVIGAEDENETGRVDFRRRIEPLLGSAPCDVDLTIETQNPRELSGAVYDSKQPVDEDASTVP